MAWAVALSACSAAATWDDLVSDGKRASGLALALLPSHAPDTRRFSLPLPVFPTLGTHPPNAQSLYKPYLILPLVPTPSSSPSDDGSPTPVPVQAL